MTAPLGRAEPLAQLKRYLDVEQRALVTLTGVAGIGKTTLAKHYLLELDDERITAMVDGSTCDSAEDVLLAIANAIGVDGTDRLSLALVDAPRILLLDNFEHLVRKVRPALTDFLAEAPELQLLVTSHGPLGIAEERVIELAPLERPRSPDDVEHCAAGELFLRQARKHCATFSFAETERKAFAELLIGLDGIPLAIELAASRAELLSISEMNARLRKRFSLLSRADEDPHHRHRSLRSALAETWSSLNPNERAVLSQCTVFDGGFTVDAAEAVVELDDPDATCLDLMHVLRRRSLVTRERTAAGHMRLDMLMSVREFAHQQLEHESRRAAERRHGRWAAHVAAQFPTLVETSLTDGLTALRAELRNLFTAADRALASRDVETAMTILGPLAEVARLLGQRTEVARRLEQLLTFDEVETLSPGALSAAWVFVGWERARGGSGDDEGDALAQRAVALAEASDDTERIADAIRYAAAARARRGDTREAAERLEKALARPAVRASRRPRAVLCDELADVYRQTGRLDEARRRGEEALTLLEEPAHSSDLVNALITLTFIHIDQGDFDLAERRAHRGLTLCASFGGATTRLELALRLATARLEHARGEIEDAAEQYAAVMDAARSLDAPQIYAFASLSAGAALAELGRLAEASERFREALPFVELADAALGGLARALLAGIEAQRGHVAEGETLLHEARTKCPAGPLALIVDACAALVDAGRLRHGHDPERAVPSTDDLSQRLTAVEEMVAVVPGPMRLELSLIARLLRARGIDAPSEIPDAPRLMVEEEGRWFEPPTGSRVRVHRRPIMRRMLVALAQARVREPGRSLTADELLAAGWPGERILPRAAKRRLQVMVTRMRDLGLRGVLETTPEDYRFDPTCVIRFEPAGES